MAKITTGPIVAEIRNALGSQVFSRNQFGAYTRARVSPDNAATPARVISKARFTAAVVSWNDDLTDNQRTAWMAYAQTLGRRAGPVNGRPFSGRSAFISAYCNLDNIGIAPLVGPPDQPLAGAVTALSLSLDSDLEQLELAGTVPAGTPSQGIVILATPPHSLSNYFNRNQALQIAAYAPGWAFPLDLWAAYVAVNPLPSAQTAVTVYTIPVAELSGLAGPTQRARAADQGTGVAMRIATATLTDAQIKALPTTPVTIVAAVAGKLIAPHMALLQLDCAAGAYTNITAAAGSNLFLVAGATKTTAVRNDGLLTPAGKRSANINTISLNDANPNTIRSTIADAFLDSSAAGVALAISAGNAAGNFTGGNAANSLKVTVWYQLVDAI